MKKSLLFIAICMICGAVATRILNTPSGFASISPEEFAALIDTADVVLLDVRTAEEHDEGHIPGTVHNLNVKEKTFIADANQVLSKDLPVALYCRSGNRSKTAATLLTDEGYKVYELSSGFTGWIEAGYPAADALIVIDDSHELLEIYYPQYDRLDLSCGIHSPEDDPNAIFCCAAAFTATYMDEFQHTNINGNHVSGGKYHKGSPYSAACFTWYNGTWKFSEKSDAEKSLKTAAANGGMGFRQIALIIDGKKKKPVMSRSNIYRALCELNGKLCVIESSSYIPMPDFIDNLSNIGVTNAIYLDMGRWNHCWYRKYAQHPVTYIYNNTHQNYTNWLTFYKE